METTSETYADPLGLAVDLNEVSTLRPVIEGNFAATIEAKVEQNKAGTGHNLVVGYKLLSEAKTIDGKAVNPGYVLTVWRPLQQSDNPKAPKYEEDIVRLIDAALKTKQGSRPAIKSWSEVPALIAGREVVIVVKAKKNKDTEEVQSEVVRVLPAAA